MSVRSTVLFSGAGTAIGEFAPVFDPRVTFDCMAYSGSVYLIVGRSGIAYTSTDLTTWTRRTIPNGVYRKVVWANNKFVAVGDAGAIIYSADGATWTSASSGTTQRLNDIIWDGSLFIVVGNYNTSTLTNTTLSSPDGIVWTAFASGISPATNFTQTAFSGGVYALATATGIYTATTLTSWTRRVTSVTYAIHWTGTKFVGFGFNKFYYSTGATGTSWQELTPAGGVTLLGKDGAIASQTYFGIEYIYVLTNLGLRYSSNGVDWYTPTYPPDVNEDDLTIGILTSPTAFLVCGERSALLKNSAAYPANIVTSLSSLRSKVGSPSSAIATDGQFLYVADSNSISKSVDGRVWTSTPTPIGVGPRCLDYGNGVYVIVHNATSTNPTNARSVDGVNWVSYDSSTSNLPLDTTAAYSKVAYLNGIWFLVGSRNFTGVLYTSSDGIVWTLRLSSGIYITDVAWSSSLNLYIAVGQTFVGQSNNVFLSSDGITWTTITTSIPSSNNLFSVIWDGAQFIAAGRGGLVMYSALGTAWTQVSFPDSVLSIGYLLFYSGLYFAVGVRLPSDNITIAYVTNQSSLSGWQQVSLGAQAVDLTARGIVAKSGVVYIITGAGNVVTSPPLPKLPF